MNKLVSLVLATLSFACSAELVEASETLSGTAEYTTDYLFRGQSQTQGDGALQASVNLEKRGLYVNAWVSDVDFVDSDAKHEIDYTIGYTLPFFADKAVIAVGAIAYTYTDDGVSFADDTKEAFIDVGVGPVNVAFFQEFGSDLDNRYYEGSLAVSELVPVPLGIDLDVLASYSDNDSSDNFSDFGFRASKQISHNLYASVVYMDEFDNWAGSLNVKF